MGLLAPIFAISLAVVVVSGSHQSYPGTSSRPILSDSEANTLSESNYFQGWSPSAINVPSKGDYVVGSGQTYTDIQAAVNAAIKAGGSTRKYIQIMPGTYAQTVYIKGSVPLTIYGSGSSPTDVKIELTQGADLSTSSYVNQVNPSGSRYKDGDPAYSTYSDCASQSSGTIGTTCSSIFWIMSDNVEVYNLQVRNKYASSSQGQSVALKTDADKITISNVYLISYQDTLYLGSGKQGVVQRVYVDNTHIQGDVDFVFGGGTGVFNKVAFTAVSDRHPSGAVIFAPSTHPTNSYGFFVINSVITGDSGFLSSKKVSLARAWDAGVSTGGYVAGTSPNGQLEIRSTRIDGVINADAPYTTATSNRAYSGNAGTSRNLNDNNYNRFWEYNNSGDGA